MKSILALLADWANGLIALLLSAYVTETQILWWYVPLALLISHLPDIDAIPELLRRGRVSASAEYVKDHRTFLHYIAISVPLCAVLFVYFGFWGMVICVAVLLHLVNDLYGTGWGLPLLWPVSKRHYKLFGRRVNWSKYDLIKNDRWDELPDSERRFLFLVTWSEDELTEYIRKWGVDNWIDEVYLKIGWVSGVEYFIFLSAATLLLMYLF